MVASPFEKIEAQLKVLATVLESEHVSQKALDKRVTHAHRRTTSAHECIEALLKRVDTLERFMKMQSGVNRCAMRTNEAVEQELRKLIRDLRARVARLEPKG